MRLVAVLCLLCALHSAGAADEAPPCLAEEGKSCKASSECLKWLSCWKGKCTASGSVKEGSECVSSEQCEDDLVCPASRKCEKALGNGDSCNQGQICEGGSMCSLMTGKKTGTCETMFNTDGNVDGTVLKWATSSEAESFCFPWLYVTKKDSSGWTCKVPTEQEWCGKAGPGELEGAFTKWCTSTKKCYRIGDESCLEDWRHMLDRSNAVNKRAKSQHDFYSCMAGSPGYAAEYPGKWSSWNTLATIFFVLFLIFLVLSILLCVCVCMLKKQSGKDWGDLGKSLNG